MYVRIFWTSAGLMALQFLLYDFYYNFGTGTPFSKTYFIVSVSIYILLTFLIFAFLSYVRDLFTKSLRSKHNILHNVIAHLGAPVASVYITIIFLKEDLGYIDTSIMTHVIITILLFDVILYLHQKHRKDLKHSY